MAWVLFKMVLALIVFSILISITLLILFIDFADSRRISIGADQCEPLDSEKSWPDLPIKTASISFVLEPEGERLPVSKLLESPKLIVQIIELQAVEDEVVPEGFVILADGAPFFDLPDMLVNAENWVAGIVQLTNQEEGCTKIWAHEQSHMLMTRKNEWLDIEDYDIPRTRFSFFQFTQAMLEVCQEILLLSQQYDAVLEELIADRFHDASPEVKTRLDDLRGEFSPAWSEWIRQMESYLEKQQNLP
ncbi:MAG: hypothetical protein KDA65_09755 [Planctomycetaceae bacterium]|nr:hypothetical protein [Planctomycetaceae bacterium]